MESHRLSFCDNCQMMIETRQWRTHPCNIAKLFSCEKCDYTSSRKSNLTRHIQRKHSEQFQCEKCSRKFKTKEKLQRHVEEVHSSCFKCEICNQQFGSLSSKKRHTKAAHMQQVVNMNIDTVETSSFTSQGTQELKVPKQVRRSSLSRTNSEPQSSSTPSDSSASSDNDEAYNSGVAAPKNQQKNLISLEGHSQRPEARPGGHGGQDTASVSNHHSLSEDVETRKIAKSLLDFGYKFNSGGRLKKLLMIHLFF